MTPGTLTDDPLLDGRADNYLAAVAFHVTRRDGYRAGAGVGRAVDRRVRRR